jgi:microcystin-dependent protein
MAQPYIGEIRMFAGTFPPSGWLFCSGQLLPISENDALFTLIGTTYGGDGQSTFGIPNLQSRMPIHMGTNPGTGTNYQIGQAAGVEEVTLTIQQIPVHTHQMLGSTDISQRRGGANSVLGRGAADSYASEFTPDSLTVQSIAPIGGSQPHTNLQPYLCVNFIISLFGIFPTQT